jgi:hypothetical protein
VSAWNGAVCEHAISTTVAAVTVMVTVVASGDGDGDGSHGGGNDHARLCRAVQFYVMLSLKDELKLSRCH